MIARHEVVQAKATVQVHRLPLRISSRHFAAGWRFGVVHIPHVAAAAGHLIAELHRVAEVALVGGHITSPALLVSTWIGHPGRRYARYTGRLFPGLQTTRQCGSRGWRAPCPADPGWSC